MTGNTVKAAYDLSSNSFQFGLDRNFDWMYSGGPHQDTRLRLRRSCLDRGRGRNQIAEKHRKTEARTAGKSQHFDLEFYLNIVILDLLPLDRQTPRFSGLRRLRKQTLVGSGRPGGNHPVSRKPPDPGRAPLDSRILKKSSRLF
jgi:hypothetical protein